MVAFSIIGVTLLVIQLVSCQTASFQSGILSSHNKYRVLHGNVPAFTSDPVLVETAIKWAKYLAAANTFDHNPNRGSNVGENIYMTFSSAGINLSKLADAATDYWYSEVKIYNYNVPNENDDIGHFTQVVWKASAKLGCGYALTTDQNTVYVVCNYSPAANLPGTYKQNVLPPSA